jgi:hypothetical protein
MTEAEWLAAEHPALMLRDLHQHRAAARTPGGRRRLRLFACACCRSSWEHFDDERCRRAVEVSERFADGEARPAELVEARREALTVDQEAREKFETVRRPLTLDVAARLAAVVHVRVAFAAVGVTATRSVTKAAEDVARQIVELRGALCEAPGGPRRPYGELLRAEARAQTALVRDIFGNPFRPAAADPAWHERAGGVVPKLARSIYAERAFDRLPVLADALEDAGCTDREILDHCRGGGTHFRGCWVVDLVLGKG